MQSVHFEITNGLKRTKTIVDAKQYMIYYTLASLINMKYDTGLVQWAIKIKADAQTDKR